MTKIIAGAVYTRSRGKETEHAVCLARVTEGDAVFGLFRRFGLSFERIKEGAEEMKSWTLVSAPEEVKPVSKKSKKVKAKN
tara:strand:+ start:293 stop:535 length:243 start_codon:yes stop_codon:yes gene_type:complete